jgi:hypothetical protein
MRSHHGRSAAPPRIGEKVSSFPAGRVCGEDRCVTVLSVYNSAAFCSVHEPRTRQPRGGGLR